MATVDITEYQNAASDSMGNRVACGVEPARGVKQLTVSGVPDQSEALDEMTRFVRIHTDSTIRIAFGADPLAGATSQRMVANSTEYFGVSWNTKISVVASN
jgi:hypothetical protein